MPLQLKSTLSNIIRGSVCACVYAGMFVCECVCVHVCPACVVAIFITHTHTHLQVSLVLFIIGERARHSQG